MSHWLVFGLSAYPKLSDKQKQTFVTTFTQIAALSSAAQSELSVQAKNANHH